MHQQVLLFMPVVTQFPAAFTDMLLANGTSHTRGIAFPLPGITLRCHGTSKSLLGSMLEQLPPRRWWVLMEKSYYDAGLSKAFSVPCGDVSIALCQLHCIKIIVSISYHQCYCINCIVPILYYQYYIINIIIQSKLYYQLHCNNCIV